MDVVILLAVVAVIMTLLLRAAGRSAGLGRDGDYGSGYVGMGDAGSSECADGAVGCDGGGGDGGGGCD